MASRLTAYVSDYLYEQRIRQDSLSVEKLATTVAPLFENASVDALSETLSRTGGEMGGRLMVLDNDGKVQLDTYAQLMGTRLQLPEVLQVLTGGKSSGYGIHQSDSESDSQDNYVSYCSAALQGSSGRIGVLLYISTVAEMMDSLARVQRQLLSIFMLVAIIALLAALVFSSVLTKPIVNLTRSIQRMGSGDLSVRVPVRGSGELRDLASSYNTMAEQLEALDKSRNQFVANASHELKTPLTSMKVLLENVIYTPGMPDDIRADFLGDVNKEIDRLASIVTDLLTLTRSDSHNMVMKIERIDLSELTEETLRLLAPTASNRKQYLRGRITPGLTIDADRSKLGQIIYNLTENAIKYTSDGGTVTVSVNAHGRNAVIAVRDTGVGIPKEDQAHIFDRFYRVDKARSRETGGTGLGLSIVKQMVTLHGGTITVESEPGKGSVFTVEIPLRSKEGKA